MTKIKALLACVLLFLLPRILHSQSCSAMITYNYIVGYCLHSTATFYAQNQAPGATYTWSATGCTIIEDNGPSIKVYFPTMGNHSISLSQNCPFSGGFPTNYTLNVYVHSGTQPNGFYGNVADTRDTVVAGIPTNVGYTWNYVPLPNHTDGYPILYPTPTAPYGTGSNMITPSSTGSHTDSVAQTFPSDYSTAKYGLAVTRWNGCADTVYNFAYVLGAINGPAANCMGDIVTYTMPVGTVNMWTVTGGTILAGQGTSTLQVQWTTAGTGSVQCNWTHGGWGSHTTSRNITVGSSSTPVITGNTTLCSAGQPYSVPNVPGHSYRWTVNGVNVGTSAMLWLQAGNQATYNLVVVDSIGSCVNTASMVVTNPVFPHPAISAPTNACERSLLTLSVAAVPGATYAWSVPGATVVSGAGTNSVVIRPMSSGYTTYSVTVSVGTCSRTVQKMVNVLESLTPDLGPDFGLCPSATATITNSTYTPGFLVSYSGSLGFNSGSNMTATTPGIYWMSVTVYHNAMTCTSRDTVIVTNAGLVSLGPDQQLCGASTTTLSPTFSGSPGPYTYAWSTGATTATVTVGPGTYMVTVTAPSGCAGADTIVIGGPAMPPVSLPANSGLCPGSSVLLDAGPGYASYLWSTGQTTQSISVTAAGAYAVTATDMAGCQSATTTSVNYFPAPGPILGMDTTICPDTFAVFSSAPFASYLWSTGASGSSIQATTPGNYTITVTDLNGCTWADTVALALNPDCIWAGDANHDGVADNADILSIGLAMAATGATRPNASTSWYGQVCADWGTAFPSTLNHKHADADGNGLVDYPDTLIVTQNYGLTHNKGAGTATGPALTFVPLQPSFTVGDVVEMGIYLGDASVQALGVNGIAYSVSVSGIVSAPGDVWFSFPPSFLGTVGTDALAVGFEDVAPGRHDAGQSRVGASPVDGYGPIAILHLRTDSLLLPSPQNVLNFSFLGVQMVGDSLQQLPIAPVNSSITVSEVSASGTTPGTLSGLDLFPVPADDMLHLRRTSDSEVIAVEVFDLAGRSCLKQAFEGMTLDLPTQSLSNGSYVLTLHYAGGGIMHRKISVMHGR